MARTSVLTGGANSFQTSAEDINRLGTSFFSPGVKGAITNTSGVAPMTGGLAVNAQGTPNTTSAITAGTCWVTATPTSQASQLLAVQIDAQNYTHASNSTGGTRYDWIYVSVSASLAAAPAADGSTTGTISVSRSTSATTDNGTPPSFGTPIAVVTLANGFSTVTNANIADKRVRGGVLMAMNDDNGNELIKGSATASAVNEVTVANAATGNNPSIAATGGDTNVGLNFITKGTGVLQVNGQTFGTSTSAGSWTSWTPTFSNFTIGNGTVSGRYQQIGKTVHFRLAVTLGSTSSMGTGPTFTLPVTASSNYSPVGDVIGAAEITDTGTANIIGLSSWASTTTAALYVQGTGGTYANINTPTSTVPMVWTNGDAFFVNGSYEAA